MLGAEGFQATTCWSWGKGLLPNITDFDVCIVNLRSLRVGNIQTALAVRQQTARLFASNGTVVVVSDAQRSVQSAGEKLKNWDYLPISSVFHDEEGQIFDVDTQDFPTYTDKLKTWKTWFSNYAGSSDMEKACANRCGINKEVLARNREGNAISFQLSANTKSGRVGRFVVLPILTDVSDREAVAAVLKDLGAGEQAQAPQWTQTVSVPGISNFLEEIGAIDRQIENLNQQKIKAQQSVDELANYRKLLYSSGTELETILRLCLEKLGATIRPAKFNEEFIAVINGQEHLVECKGVSKSASLTHYRQANDHALVYEEETQKHCHSLLFVNAWREIEPSKRGSKEYPLFPSPILERAAANDMAVVASHHFFQAYCKFLDQPQLAARLLSKLAETKGFVDLEDL